MKFPEHAKSHLFIVSVFAWRNRFIKLVYLEPILKGKIKPCENLPSQFLKIVDVIDDLIMKAEAAAKVDVYAIADPKLALEALRQKWLGVEERVSQYDMPDYTEEFSELDRTQDWCAEDIENRAEDFADAAREGIRLKIQPPIWYYNYACALARMGKKDEAIQALEQAIASGYDETDHAKDDDDLASLRTDARFTKLMDMSDEIERDWRSPKKSAPIEDGMIRLDESNIYWVLKDSSYQVDVTGVTSNTLIYLNHDTEDRPAPVSDMVTVEYAEELQDRGRTCGVANFNFQDVQTRKPIPTLLACAAMYEEDRTNDVQSVPARMWSDADASWNETLHLYANVLGVYDIGADYADDGVDRIFGWSPVSLAYHSQEESDDLVRICAEAWRALKPEVREKGGIRQLLGVIRRGQKCVTTEQDFMSSSAQRPAIIVEEIDEEKVLGIASKLNKPYPEIPFISRSALSFEMTAVTDLRSLPYDQALLSDSQHHAAYVARWAEMTGKIEVVVARGVARDADELVWKVLQGDPSKIRFKQKESIEDDGRFYDVMEISCDYHEAFDVALPSGKKMKSMRVDIGCFRVEDGVASCPAIVSIYYMPAEKREYGEDGLLKSIDYTKPQITGWMPRLCPKANFKDEFHWNKERKCTGWTRIDSAGKKTEFTRDGFVVMTRDGQGRPLDVRRSLTMEWMQQMSPSALASDEEFVVQSASFGLLYDVNKAPPQETTLAWRYVYKDENDALVKPSPKDTVKFTYRPELCSRADLSEESGFRLPLMTQMMLGEHTYVNYKHGLLKNDIRDGESPTDMIRSDSRYALKELNLEPPAKLKKMQFCPWRASTNDLWKLDMDDFEETAASALYELADGVYRLRLPPTKQGTFFSVRQSYFVQNMYAEKYAFAKLDRAYRRCTEAEAQQILGKSRSVEDWKTTIFTERQPISKEDLPKGVTKALALWQITGDIYIGIFADHETPFGRRQYFYVRVGENSEVISFDYFDELPSRAIGNAVLGAYAGKSEALNNFAVLLYCEIANPKNYDESAVVALLERAARQGCPTATYNLGVLYYNRGEEAKARQYFEKAPLSESKDEAKSDEPR